MPMSPPSARRVEKGKTTMTSLYAFSRKLHRYLVLIMLGLLLVMAGTGLIMRYPGWFSWLPAWLPAGKVRYLHANVSTYFAVVIIIMALTGAYMYFHTQWVQRKQEQLKQRQPPPATPPQQP